MMKPMSDNPVQFGTDGWRAIIGETFVGIQPKAAERIYLPAWLIGLRLHKFFRKHSDVSKESARVRMVKMMRGYKSKLNYGDRKRNGS